MSSVECNERGGELNGSEKSVCAFVVSRCNGSELFEMIEETLDEIAFAIKREVCWPWPDTIGFWWNHRVDMTFFEMVDQRVGVVGFVRKEGLGINLFQKRLGLRKVRCLAGRQGDRHRIAERIDDHMYLRRQSSSGSTDRLAPPFCAPALCWWARTMVESSIMYSLS